MCSLIADCTSVEDRNKFLTYLEAVTSAAFIIGPAIGGFLGSKNYSFPVFRWRSCWYCFAVRTVYDGGDK